MKLGISNLIHKLTAVSTRIGRIDYLQALPQSHVTLNNFCVHLEPVVIDNKCDIVKSRQYRH